MKEKLGEAYNKIKNMESICRNCKHIRCDIKKKQFYCNSELFDKNLQIRGVVQTCPGYMKND